MLVEKLSKLSNEELKDIIEKLKIEIKKTELNNLKKKIIIEEMS